MLLYQFNGLRFTQKHGREKWVCGWGNFEKEQKKKKERKKERKNYKKVRKKKEKEKERKKVS